MKRPKMALSTSATLLLLAILAVVPAAHAAAAWTKVLDKAPWAARSDPQLALLGDTLFLMGGHKNNEYYNDVWSSADGGLTWTEQPAAPWAPRSYHTAKAVDGFIYLLAGHDAKVWYNDVWRTKDGQQWEQVTAAAAWAPRAAAALQAINGSLLLMGGSDGLLKPIGNGTCFNDVWRSDDGGLNWTLATASAPWPAREGLQKLTTARGADGTILLTAGEAGYFGPYFHDVWTTKDGVEWTAETADAGFSARSGNLLAKGKDGSIFTFGGYGFPKMKHDAYCLPAGSPAGGKWTRLEDAGWKGRFDYDIETLQNGSMILLGGEASLFGFGGPYFADVWMLNEPTC